MSDARINGSRMTSSDVVDTVTPRSFVQNSANGVQGTDSCTLNLSTEQATAMSKSVLDIFESEEKPPKEDGQRGDADEGEDGEVDLADQQRRTEKLKGALSVLAQLWKLKSNQIDLVTEKLADGSRDPKWRIALGDSGILNFFLGILDGHDLRHNLKIHVLRLIGNSCADTDENRARVVASGCMRSIILQLHDEALISFAIPVLYNICIDSEPAQKQASECLLTQELIALISSSKFHNSRAFLGYSCRILDLMVAQASEVELAPDFTPILLLRIAADREAPVDMDDFVALVNTALAYLQHEKFQKALIAQGALDDTLKVLLDSYTRFDSHPSVSSVDATPASDQNDAKALSQMRSTFNQVLSDVSALSEFQEAYPITSPLSSSLQCWLSSPQLQLKVCACIMLGNLARSDGTCEEFVHVARIHTVLIAILVDANDSQLLHATVGFLKNLALPARNKDALGDAGLFDVLPRLWALDVLQPIQFSSISLARQLTVGNLNNVRRVCERLSDDTDSPEYTRSKLSLLIGLFERTDVEPIKMEIARLVTSICRVFNSGAGPDGAEDETARIQSNFFGQHPDVGRPLGFMVSQTKWPVVRSEGWFVFALMARSPEGAQCISDLMLDVAVFRPLVEMLTGKPLADFEPPQPPGTSSAPTATAGAGSSSPDPSPHAAPSSASPNTESVEAVTAAAAAAAAPGSAPAPESAQPHPQASEMQRLDRENALVLISELLKNRGAQMAAMRRTRFEDLLRGGSQLLQSHGDASSSSSWRGPATVPTPPRANSSLQETAEQSVRGLP